MTICCYLIFQKLLENPNSIMWTMLMDRNRSLTGSAHDPSLPLCHIQPHLTLTLTFIPPNLLSHTVSDAKGLSPATQQKSNHTFTEFTRESNYCTLSSFFFWFTAYFPLLHLRIIQKTYGKRMQMKGLPKLLKECTVWKALCGFQNMFVPHL